MPGGMVIRQCASCHRVVERDDEGGPAIVFSLCLACLPSFADYPVADVSALTPEEADRLPFGFIRLDRRGRVTAYNEEESRRSRLAPPDVLGRDFFRDIAPCTNVAALAGWVDHCRQRGKSGTRQLQFVFTFPFGRELVEMSLTYNAAKKEAYILVRSGARETDAVPEPA